MGWVLVTTDTQEWRVRDEHSLPVTRHLDALLSFKKQTASYWGCGIENFKKKKNAHRIDLEVII